MKSVQQLIYNTTGESYDVERLKKLPLDPKFGRWVLTDGSTDYGIFWAMQLSEKCARVLAFSVSVDLQGSGWGANGWSRFSSVAKSLGIREVQLEVRQDNQTAIAMYHRRALRPKGVIRGFYRGNDGWLMRGPLRVEASSQ